MSSRWELEVGLELPETTSEILAGLRSFVEHEVIPRHDNNEELFSQPHLMYDATGRYCDEILSLRREVRVASAAAGYYTLLTPEALGGGGEGALTMFAAWQDLYHHYGMKYWLAYDVVAHWVSGPSSTLSLWSEAYRKRILPGVLSGEKTLCFAMSEPDAGTDVWMMSTRAERTESGWRITGTKQWTSNGPYADFALVFAVTDIAAAKSRKGGISAFLVPSDSPGYQVDSVIRVFGHAGGNEAIISLTNVEVGDDQLVGELGRGLEIGLLGIGQGRLYNAAKGVGLARWGLEQAVEHAKLRVTFGKPLIEHQSIAFLLAEAAMEILPAHLLGLHAAGEIDAGRDARMVSAMAKANSVEMSARVLERVVQTLGGIGFTNEMHITHAWQEMRIVHVADGSAQMQRRIIAGRLAAGDFNL
jgi:acyl-CoA dehydrogenase